MMASPSPTDPLAAMKVSAAASTGPVQGAAMTPATSPMPKAPARPAPPTPLSRCCSEAGRESSKAPNMEAAITTSTSATPPITQPFCITEPKAWPVSAAPTPSAE